MLGQGKVVLYTAKGKEGAGEEEHAGRESCRGYRGEECVCWKWILCEQILSGK